MLQWRYSKMNFWNLLVKTFFFGWTLCSLLFLIYRCVMDKPLFRSTPIYTCKITSSYATSFLSCARWDLSKRILKYYSVCLSRRLVKLTINSILKHIVTTDHLDPSECSIKVSHTVKLTSLQGMKINSSLISMRNTDYIHLSYTILKVIETENIIQWVLSQYFKGIQFLL